MSATSGYPCNRKDGDGKPCPQRILFVRMASAKTMPVNAEPDDEGNVAAMRDASGTWVGHVLHKDEQPQPGERRYMPHFATCPSMKKKDEEPAVLPPNVVRMADFRGR